MLLVTGGLLVLAGVSTFVLAERTEDYFAWTIQPPLTAAFMGGSYWATIALVVLAARAPDWAHARIAVPATLGFAALILLATFLHFDRFHQQRPITWAWVAIYAVIPPLIAVFALREARAAREDPARVAPLPRWLRLAVLAQGLTMLSLGLGLFVAPTVVDVVWPWSLTPLTGRVVGAYLVGLALGALHSVVENDWRRVRPAAAATGLFGALQLVNVARFGGTFDWGDARTWAYCALLLLLLALGVEALRRARESSRATTVTAPAAAQPR